MPRGATFFYWLLKPMERLLAVISGTSLDAFLLHRHVIIDHLLEKEIAVAPVTAIVEIGAGFSARGHLFLNKFAAQRLTYLELDLPDVIVDKQKLIAAWKIAPKLSLHSCDITDHASANSLRRIIDRHVPREARLVLLTEGLVDYFGIEALHEIWSEMAAILRDRGGGVYLSDITPRRADHPAVRYIRWGVNILSWLVHKQVPNNFRSDADVERALHAVGLVVEIFNPVAFDAILPAHAREEKPVARIVRAVLP